MSGWRKYQKPAAHVCKWPGYLSIEFHGGFFENASVWTCNTCAKTWRPKWCSNNSFTWLEVKVGEAL